MKRYLAIIGDLIDSKKIENRDDAQNKLQENLDALNDIYSSFIVSKFLITLGDEIQGLVVPYFPIVIAITTTLDSIYPLKMRFGLGLGNITTPINEYAIGMDGPAFYDARKAIDSIKKYKISTLRMESKVLNDINVLTINTLCGTLFQIRQSWTKKFKQNARYFRTNLTQAQMAKLLNIKQSSVSSLLKNAGWAEYLKYEKDITTILKNMTHIEE